MSGFSICIAELPTNGLDAKTAFEVVNSARTVAKAGNKSMIMSLAQPSPELFNLFDNCCLLAMGECIYFGPQSEVQHYLLTQCKLIQPENKSLPAWIEELTVKPSKFMSDSLRNEMISSQLNPSSPSALLTFTDRQIIRFLAKKFRNSKYFADLSKEVLWRHLDLIHADTKCKKIPEEKEPGSERQNEEEKKDEEEKEMEEADIEASNTTSTNDKEGEPTKTTDSENVNDNNNEDTIFSTGTGTGSGFGSLMMQLHRKTTDKFSNTVLSGLNH